MTPLQVYQVESLRKSPFCAMFGCAEWESVAAAVVKFMAKNNLSWADKVDFYTATVEIEQLLWYNGTHAHGHEKPFDETYLPNGIVTQQFIDNVTRVNSGYQFKPEVIEALCNLVELTNGSDLHVARRSNP